MSTSIAKPNSAAFVTGTGGLSAAGASGQSWNVERSSGALSASVAPAAPNTPAAQGSPRPTRSLNGEPVCERGELLARLRGVERGARDEPPSMNTSPSRSRAPARPPKSQLAYAVAIVPPSEWPPSTTLRPPRRAARTTCRRSPTATRIPHSRAGAVSASDGGVKCSATLPPSQPR